MSYVPRPIEPQANARTLEQRRLDTADIHEFVERTVGRSFAQWPPPAWNLDVLTAASFRLNPQVAVSRAEYERARASIITARERPNPTASASIEHKPSGIEPSPWVSTFDLDVPIEMPAKRRARVDQAIHATNAALARVSTTAWDVRSRLRGRLLDVWAAQRREGVLEREENIERDIVEIFTKRVQYGEAAQPDLSRARIALGQTTLLLSDVRRAAREGRAATAAAIGIPDESLAGPLDLSTFDAATPAIAADLREAALVARADVRAALEDYAAADDALRLEVARQYPDLHIGPGFGWDQGTRTWMLAAAAEVPIMNRHRGAIAEASARRDEAAARFTALQASVIGAFDAARIGVEAARQKLFDAEALVASQRASVDSVRRQFEAGEIDRLALRSAELELEAANLGRADAAAELQQARGLLEDAIQNSIGERTP
ncbi:MAG TPA: TolC family protein [Thermoanaerobaculia bacterium]